jgi:hypothetical protein
MLLCDALKIHLSCTRVVRKNGPTSKP